MPTNVVIRDYEPQYQPAFQSLNEEWISRYFTLEEPDYQMLNDPHTYILSGGGHILMAEHQGNIV